MQRPLLLSALLTTGLLTAIVAQPSFGDQGHLAQPAQFVQVKQIQANAQNVAPLSRMEGERALRDAMAGAVIGAIASQFDETEVEVKLEGIHSEQINLIDNSISGEGRIRLGTSDTWIPVAFQGLYDTNTATVSAPQLKLGGQKETARAVAPVPALRDALQLQMTQRLQAEFRNQPVTFALHDAKLQKLDQQHSHLTATGVADFGAEGTAVTTIDAVYDSRNGQWLQMAYILGEETGA